MIVIGEGTHPESAERWLRWEAWRLWLLIPVLAVAAYAPVLSMWFVADDFDFLGSQEGLTLTGSFLDFWDGQLLYRPLSTIITWGLGYNLFGTNALPYHAISLVLHALVAWMSGRTVATISGETAYRVAHRGALRGLPPQHRACSLAFLSMGPLGGGMRAGRYMGFRAGLEDARLAALRCRIGFRVRGRTHEGEHAAFTGAFALCGTGYYADDGRRTTDDGRQTSKV